MKRFCIFAIALAALTTPAFSQDAANYPSRPIRMIVPFAPGGGLDISTRLIGQKLTEKWGKTSWSIRAPVQRPSWGRKLRRGPRRMDIPC